MRAALARAARRAMRPPPATFRAIAATAAAPPRVAVVQGASRGLGLELARQLALARGATVVATCRDPGAAAGLAALVEEAPRGSVTVLRLDATDEASIVAAAAAVGDAHGRADLVINAAGILHGTDFSPETSLAKLDPATLARVYAVNAIGPALVAREFAGLLTVAGKERLKAGLPPAVLASLSARVGSVGDNGTGGWYAYRASKVSEREGGGGRRRRGCRAASLSRPLDRTLPSPPQTALNQLMKTAAVELARKRSGVAVACLHPGTCETDLSAPFRRSVPADKLFPVECGAAQLLDVIDALALEESGCFKAWDGSTIPW